MGLLMFGSHVLCIHMWPWGEGCDLQGCPGSRALRAASEKQNDGAWGRRREPCPKWQQFTQLFIYSFVHVSRQGLSWALPTHYQFKLELANALL